MNGLFFLKEKVRIFKQWKGGIEMKKKLLLLMAILTLALCLAPAAMAADEKTIDTADALYTLGLFEGTGTDADGAPVYALDRSPTRNEAIVMLIRLLGKEQEALSGDWDMPFTDVTNWVKPYVGYAYANGLTDGTTPTTFSGNKTVTATQYLTFVLRALGYKDGTDFSWDKAWKLSDEIGLTNGEYSSGSTGFLRGDVVLISAQALQVNQKDGGDTLAEKLIEDGVFTEEQYEGAKELMDRQSQEDTLPNESGLTEAQLKNAVQALAHGTMVHWLYDDYNGDAAYEAFAVYAQKMTDDGHVSNANIYYVSSEGIVAQIASGTYGYLSNSVTGGGQKFIVWERNAYGSGSTSLIYGVDDTGMFYEPAISGLYEWFYQDAGTGKYYAYTNDFSAGFHQYIKHQFVLDLVSGEFY
jgi:hypothetical protein